jgi:hypothetical protein
MYVASNRDNQGCVAVHLDVWRRQLPLLHLY